MAHVRTWRSLVAADPARRGDSTTTTAKASSFSSSSSVAGLHGGNCIDLTAAGSVDDDDDDDECAMGGRYPTKVTHPPGGGISSAAYSVSNATANNKRPKPCRRVDAVDVIDLVGCSSSSSEDDDDGDDYDDGDDGTREVPSPHRRRNGNVVGPFPPPHPPPASMRRKRTRGPPPTPTVDDDDCHLVEHVNLPPRGTRDGATVTFGLLGLVDVLMDRNTLTSEGDPATSMTKLLEPVRGPPPSHNHSTSSSSSCPIPYNRQPLHYLQNDNWSCGYRNLQMLISGMMPTLSGVFPGGVPCIEEIQRTMEELWGRGYDCRNAEHHGRSLVGKKTWIGTVEVWSYLTFKRVDSIIVQFIKTARNRALLGKFVWAYFGRMCGCPCRGGVRHDGDDDDDECAMGGRYPTKATHPPCVEHADNLIRAITGPDFDSRLASAAGVRGSRTGRRRRRMCDCSLPPLYLQWEGHSVTVVGVRRVDDATSGNPPSFALVVFCPQKNVADIKGALAREFVASMGGDDGFDFANDSERRPQSSSGGGGEGGRTVRSVVELPASRLLQKDCQILLSAARVIAEGESNMRKFCSSNLGFLNAVSIYDDK